MKKMKKFVSVLLTMVMVLSMSVGVFATGTTSLTIKSTEDNHKYVAYQIFKGTPAVETTEGVTNDVLSNIEWGSGVDDEALLENNLFNALETDDAEDAAKFMNSTAFDTAEEKEALAAAIAGCVTGNGTAVPYDDQGLTLDATDGKNYYVYKVNTLEPGYYLIKDEYEFDNNTTDSYVTYTSYLLKVVKDATIYSKSGIPTVNKYILDPNRTEFNSAYIGEVVNYEIEGTLPSNIADYNTYFYEFTDTLSKGLDYNDDVTVTVNGERTTGFTVTSSKDETTGITTIKVAIQNLLSLGNITSATKVVVNYSATLNSEAVINGDGNPNEVYLTFSNDPNRSDSTTTTPPTPDHPVGETPKDEVTTYTTKLVINKVKENGIDPLTGVTFALYAPATEAEITAGTLTLYYRLNDGTFTTTAKADAADTDKDKYVEPATAYIIKVERQVDEKGQLTITGLAEGTYILRETVTPAGYNTIEDIVFTLTLTEETKDNQTTYVFSSNNPTVTLNEKGTEFVTTIVNYKGTILPSTGGMGTTILYVVGTVMVLGAAVVLITRRRMSR